MPELVKKSIRSKFRTVFVLMSVGPILLVGIFIGWMSYHTQLDYSIRYQQEINERVIEQVER